MLFNHLSYNVTVWVGTRASKFLPDGGLRCVTWNTRGLIGSVSTSQISKELKLGCFKRLIENNNVICLQEVHGKDEFLQAIQVWAPRFSLYGTFLPGKLNTGGSAMCIHKDLLPDGAVLTHVITCQGGDHIVNVRSGRRNLVVVNVHFEPKLTLRNFARDYVPITPHWPQYANAIGIIMGDFNICEPEEGTFNVWLAFSKLPAWLFKERFSHQWGCTHAMKD